MEKVTEFSDNACPKCGGDGSIRLVRPEWLRAQREKAKLTLREVARRLEFSAAYLCDVEHGRRACSAKIHDFYKALRPR